MRKQKLFNKGNSVLFIDSTNIKVRPDENRSQNTQEQSIGRPKYPKNNSYLLMDRTYEDGKNIALAKAHGFHSVVPTKKIVNHFDYTINSFINNEMLLNNISLV